MCIVRKSVAGAALAVVASGVAAQSSVTLYGVADAFFQWYDNGGQHSWSMEAAATAVRWSV